MKRARVDENAELWNFCFHPSFLFCLQIEMQNIGTCHPNLLTNKMITKFVKQAQKAFVYFCLINSIEDLNNKVLVVQAD